jgi:hypothetical protein
MDDRLHQLLRDARGELPPTTVDLDEISARGRRHIRRRRWSVVAAAVAVTLAAGSLFPFVRDDHRPSPPATHVPAAAGFAARVQGFTSGDYRVGASIMVTPGYEIAPIYRDSTRVAGSVEVYHPGAFDPRIVRTGTPVTVGSTPGFRYVATTTVRYGTGQKLAEIKKPAVAWSYADDAWAVVRSADDTLSTDALQGLASHLTLGPATPVRLPFRLGYVPPGLSTQAAGRTSLAPTDDPAPGRLGEMTLAAPHSFTGLTGPLTLAGATIVEEHRAGGVPAGTTCDGSGCYRALPDTDLSVGVTGTLPSPQLRQILDGVTTADPADPATWFPVPN